MTPQEIRDLHTKYLFPAVVNYYQESLPLVRGKGTSLWDADGREYLDFFGGILTVSLGHCDEEVNGKIKAQVDTLQHTSTLYPTPPIVLLAKRLAEIAPQGSGISQSFFTSSGTEADETAIMLAKIATGQQEVIVQRHSYSGRSHLNTTLTAHANYRPLPSQIAGVKHIHAPYCYRCPFNASPTTCDLECARDMKELIETTTNGRPAAFMAEPIMGVGGFITPHRDYFKVAVEIVRAHGGLFIADEVQTFARTGDTWWGIEQYGVQPDIITTAKGIANGAPMGVTMTRPELAKKWTASTISTFGGNPVSCTAATATLDAIDTRGLLANAAAMGQRLRARLEEMQARYPLIGEVRGMGLMQALELVEDRKTKVPAKRAIAALFEEARRRGLLIGKGGLYGNVVRITPPLNVTADEVDRAMTLLDEAFTEVTARVPA
ncbi:MAG: aspartate aminotransferase family protein [Planctomycetota bacterium]|nr:aspartate aminotransferase family protein [Planctomycetota bacterium]